MSSDGDDVLTLSDASRLLKVAEEDLVEELESGRLPGIRIGNHWRLSRNALKMLMGTVASEISPQSGQRSESTRHSGSIADTTGSTSDGESVNPEKEVVAGQNSPSERYSINGSARTTVDSKVTNGSESQSASLDPSVQGLSRAKVHLYNFGQMDGYARMADNRTVLLDSRSFENSTLLPLPGDVVEFELLDNGKSLRARSGRVVTLDRAGREINRSSPSLSSRMDAASSDAAFSSKGNIEHTGTPESQRLYTEAAKARVEGRLDDARKYFWRAIDAGAGVQTYETFFAMEHALRGSSAEARKIVLAGIEKFGSRPNFYILYGQMERRDRRYSEAERIFREALEKFPSNSSLLWGLAQTLVQIGSEVSLKEAGDIFDDLDRMGKLNRNDNVYQNFLSLQRNPRATQALDFFKAVDFKVSIAGHRNLPHYATDIVVEINHAELKESFGMTGHFLVRCFSRSPSQIDVLDLSKYLSDLGSEGVVGVRGGRSVLVNSGVAFIAVANGDAVRDQIMSILSDKTEAIVPLDDTVLSNRQDPLGSLRYTLGQYLGARDLYSTTAPVAGYRRFFGREQLLIQLADQLHMGNFVGIYGLRKMGKTSLVYQLRDEKLKQEAVAYVDLQASAVLSTRSCDALYWELEQELYKRLREIAPDVAQDLVLGRIDDFEQLEKLTSPIPLVFLQDMKKLLDAVAEGRCGTATRVIFVLDELERMLPVSEYRGGIEGYLDFFGHLRGLAQIPRYQGLISVVVVAANAAVSERGYWEGRENPVFAFFKSTFLPPFSADESKEMITSLGRGMSVYWEEDAIHEIYKETGGHPFLTRSFCSHVSFVVHRDVRPLMVTREMVSTEVDGYLRADGDKLGQITELLRVNFPEEEQALEDIALERDTSNFRDESLSHLIGYHLVEPTNDGGFKVSIELLRRWLRRRAGYR